MRLRYDIPASASSRREKPASNSPRAEKPASSSSRHRLAMARAAVGDSSWLARLLGSCEPCRAFKCVCAGDLPGPRTPSSASTRSRCSESTSARSRPPRTSLRCTHASPRAAVAVAAARALRAPLIRRDSRDPRMGPRGAAAPHATPAESAGATERLLRPPGRVIIGPLDGAAEHGPRRPMDQDDDPRREAALRDARRAAAGRPSRQSLAIVAIRKAGFSAFCWVHRR